MKAIEDIKSKVYVYKCLYCGTSFELFQDLKEKEVFCSSTCMIAEEAVKKYGSKI